MTPTAAVTPVDCLHRTLAVVERIDLRIPIVEAAAAIVVLSASDHQHALRLVARGHTPSRLAAIAVAAFKVRAVYRVAAHGNLVLRRVDSAVRVSGGATRRSDREVIALGRLVEDACDGAVCAGAEGVLRL